MPSVWQETIIIEMIIDNSRPKSVVQLHGYTGQCNTLFEFDKKWNEVQIVSGKLQSTC